jgi:2-polyprenyl-3-methyl-5-hydroxy-6-metoxy-1,4-benzoquinol methylase
LILDSELQTSIKVAVVGGSNKDLEISILEDCKKSPEIRTFGIENSDVYLDLNHAFNPREEFDLVICSHVYEHIWNLPNATSNLTRMLKQGGYVWISVPISNRKHGSPEYFSSGYPSTMLRKLLEQENVMIIECEDLGTERNYKYVHMFQRWPSDTDLTTQIKNLKFNLTDPIISLRRIFRQILIRQWDSKVLMQTVYSTES